MNDLYTKADVNPIELAARLRLAILLLEPVMQAAEPHSAEDKDLRDLLGKMQWELDSALKTAVYENKARLDAGLITFENYAADLSTVMEGFYAYRITKNEDI